MLVTLSSGGYNAYPNLRRMPTLVKVFPAFDYRLSSRQPLREQLGLRYGEGLAWNHCGQEHIRSWIRCGKYSKPRNTIGQLQYYLYNIQVWFSIQPVLARANVLYLLCNLKSLQKHVYSATLFFCAWDSEWLRKCDN